MTQAECDQMVDAITFLAEHDDHWCRAMGGWAQWYYDGGRYSAWSWIASHYDTVGKTIQIHADRFPQPRDSLVTAMLHEILHSPWFGVEHEHNPDTFQVSEYCVGGEAV